MEFWLQCPFIFVEEQDVNLCNMFWYLMSFHASRYGALTAFGVFKQRSSVLFSFHPPVRHVLRVQWQDQPLRFFCQHRSSPVFSRVPLPAIFVTKYFGLHSRQMCAESSHPQNRLALEKSPYLLQHASNPVDWYPWGREAIQKAKDEGKPIFLSIGYSTCHWCHVMERESFDNVDVAEILNKYFISIKVDREERPDVDRVYMTFIQATSGNGGWPMSLWLTPDLAPLFGGTYFPPEDRYYGQPGFKSLLLMIAEKWKDSRKDLEEQGTIVLDALMQGTQMTVDPEVAMPTFQTWDKLYESLEKSFDEIYGGFGISPKFPQPSNFNFLFRLYSRERNTDRGKKALAMCLHTLKMMAKGGFHDHISQGFHRYSTDRIWHVPHFEKMLYDQGQMAGSYINAYQVSKNEFYANIARDIYQYVNRDLSHPEGGFYSAEDADSLPTEDSEKKKEGAFCVWTWEELHSLLGEKIEGGKGNTTLADLFCYHYGCKEEGNVDPMQDPHDELKNQNVLFVSGSIEKTAEKLRLSVDAAKTALHTCHDILFDWRQHRPKPHLDDKMVSGWHGLMISGFARGAQVLGDPTLAERASKAVQFLQTHLYRAEDNTLLRSCYKDMDGGVTQSSTPIAGFLDDYAFIIRGLLDLYEATLDDRWLQWCEKLQAKQDQLFWDEEDGGYYCSEDGDSTVVLRLKEAQDGAEPGANSVSCMNLLRLSSYLGDSAMQSKAERIFRLFAKFLNIMPAVVPEMACALPFYLESPKQIVIVGSPESDDTKAMLKEVHEHYIRNRILILADGSGKGFLYDKIDILKSLKMVDGKATAYVCEHFTCSAPTNSLEKLREQLAS